MARPTLKLDEEQIKKLASIHCTQEEIALVMGCSVDTLYRRYAGLIKEGQAHGKTSLRRHMWKKVVEGNCTMMIWLSKQHLDMVDKKIDPEVENVSQSLIDLIKNAAKTKKEA